MMRRWNRWRFARPSRVRYALVPHGTRLVASGLIHTVRLVELRPW